MPRVPKPFNFNYLNLPQLIVVRTSPVDLVLAAFAPCSQGDVEQTFNAFKIVLDGDHDNVLAPLGQACVHFNRGRYSEALELYKSMFLDFTREPAG
ncbi:binding protein [Perilla frutescens var. hirtella]|nr:binding protein [Perilla frutescens var. hirtella]KAH6805487.1 binding protein [Perilla frutescens var. frutescens]